MGAGVGGRVVNKNKLSTFNKHRKQSSTAMHVNEPVRTLRQSDHFGQYLFRQKYCVSQHHSLKSS